MRKKLILISGSPCVGKTAAGTRLFERYNNSAYLDGDWCWCVHPFSVADPRLRNGDRSMSFILSNYLDSGFEYVFFTSVVLTDARVREGILSGITAGEYETVGFTLTCSEETLKKRHDRRGDKGETDYRWLRLPPYPGDIVIDTEGKSVGEVVREMKRHIDASGPRRETVIQKVDKDTELARMLLDFVENCSWTGVREHIAGMIRDWQFTDWETMFAAIRDGKIAGMASVMKTDYYPLPDVFPWVSCIFVSEAYRGQKISGELIAHANRYLKELGFKRSYIPSEFTGLYERYGYAYLRDIVNYGGGTDHLFVKEF